MTDTTIVVPSTCEASRAGMLERALRSLEAQRVPPRVLVVANGPGVDPALADSLARRPGVDVARLETGSLPAALRHGRSRVTTPFFGFLDDDDEYLAGAIDLRLAPMLADPTVDAVATNGYTNVAGVDRVRHEHPDRAAADPLRALVGENWLASCGGLYRSASVPLELFDGVTRWYEWTVLGFKLASSCKVRYLPALTFRVHDSPRSLSKSREFRVAEPQVLEMVARLPDLPPDVREALRRKIGRAHHGLSSMYLASGERGLALRHHLRSVAAPGGLAYVAYTRKLLPFWPRPRSTAG